MPCKLSPRLISGYIVFKFLRKKIRGSSASCICHVWFNLHASVFANCDKIIDGAASSFNFAQEKLDRFRRRNVEMSEKGGQVWVRWRTRSKVPHTRYEFARLDSTRFPLSLVIFRSNSRFRSGSRRSISVFNEMKDARVQSAAFFVQRRT